MVDCVIGDRCNMKRETVKGTVYVGVRYAPTARARASGKDCYQDLPAVLTDASQDG